MNDQNGQPEPEADQDTAKDSPDRDQNHDESRRNGFDPEVAEGMGIEEE